MKKIVLILCFVFGFCFGDEALNLEIVRAQDLDLNKQVSILNEAILNNDYEKAKIMLDKNPNLVNISSKVNSNVYETMFLNENSIVLMANFLYQYDNFENLNNKLKERLIYKAIPEAYLLPSETISLLNKIKNSNFNFRIFNDNFSIENSNYNVLKSAYFLGNIDIFSFFMENRVILNEQNRFLLFLYIDILECIDNNFLENQNLDKVKDIVKTSKYNNCKNKYLKYLKIILKYQDVNDIIFDCNFLIDFAYKINDYEILNLLEVKHVR